MKSIKTDILSNLDLDELRSLFKFTSFLYKLNIKSFEDFEDYIHDEITENYCSECESMHDHCECRNYDGYEIDEDAAYDAWKDQQMMDED
jgi:hypothetical protein